MWCVLKGSWLLGVMGEERISHQFLDCTTSWRSTQFFWQKPKTEFDFLSFGLSFIKEVP